MDTKLLRRMFFGQNQHLEKAEQLITSVGINFSEQAKLSSEYWCLSLTRKKKAPFY